MKNAGMRIRVEPELREQFVKLCRHKDMPAAQVLRAFMKRFVEQGNVRFQGENEFDVHDVYQPKQDSIV